MRHGYFNVYTPHTFNEERYFEFVSSPHNESYEETVSHTSFLLRDAIKRQMKSDTPICTMLSGGLDSSIVTSYCAKELGIPIDTYSFDFIDNDKYFKSNSFQPELDRPYVLKMVDLLKTNHEFLYCDYEELANLLYDTVDAKDIPGMADVDSSLLHFCKIISKKHKVALTGECSDEIFGG